jgi:hypothetical protein
MLWIIIYKKADRSGRHNLDLQTSGRQQRAKFDAPDVDYVKIFQALGECEGNEFLP